MKIGPVRAIGIPWYRREDWAELRQLFTDTHVLDDTYEAWLRKAEKLLDNFNNQGRLAEKVYIDPVEFRQWCASRGLDLNAKARTEFASEFVARKYQNRS